MINVGYLHHKSKINGTEDYLFKYFSEDINIQDNYCDETTDIIYCAQHLELKRGWKAKKRFNKPLICWVWDICDNIESTCRNGDELSYYRKSNRKFLKDLNLLRKCDKLLTSSKYTHNKLSSYELDSEILPPHFNNKILDLYKRDDIKKTNNVIQVSRLLPHKRFDITRDSIVNTDINACFIGPRSNEYSKSIEEFSNINIKYNLKKIDVVKEIQSSDILVSPSVFEGFGLSIAEAIYLNVPVIASDIEIFKEMWGDTIYYFEKDNPEDLNKKINYVLNNKELADDKVLEAKERLNLFLEDKHIERLEKLFLQ